MSPTLVENNNAGSPRPRPPLMKRRRLATSDDEILLGLHQHHPAHSRLRLTRRRPSGSAGGAPPHRPRSQPEPCPPALLPSPSSVPAVPLASPAWSPSAVDDHVLAPPLLSPLFPSQLRAKFLDLDMDVDEDEGDCGVAMNADPFDHRRFALLYEEPYSYDLPSFYGADANDKPARQGDPFFLSLDPLSDVHHALHASALGCLHRASELWDAESGRHRRSGANRSNAPSRSRQHTGSSSHSSAVTPSASAGDAGVYFASGRQSSSSDDEEEGNHRPRASLHLTPSPILAPTESTESDSPTSRRTSPFQSVSTDDVVPPPRPPPSSLAPSTPPFLQLPSRASTLDSLATDAASLQLGSRPVTPGNNAAFTFAHQPAFTPPQPSSHARFFQQQQSLPQYALVTTPEPTEPTTNPFQWSPTPPSFFFHHPNHSSTWPPPTGPAPHAFLGAQQEQQQQEALRLFENFDAPRQPFLARPITSHDYYGMQSLPVGHHAVTMTPVRPMTAGGRMMPASVASSPTFSASLVPAAAASSSSSSAAAVLYGRGNGERTRSAPGHALAFVAEPFAIERPPPAAAAAVVVAPPPARRSDSDPAGPTTRGGRGIQSLRQRLVDRHAHARVRQRSLPITFSAAGPSLRGGGGGGGAGGGGTAAAAARGSALARQSRHGARTLPTDAPSSQQRISSSIVPLAEPPSAARRTSTAAAHWHPPSAFPPQPYPSRESEQTTSAHGSPPRASTTTAEPSRTHRTDSTAAARRAATGPGSLSASIAPPTLRLSTVASPFRNVPYPLSPTFPLVLQNEAHRTTAGGGGGGGGGGAAAAAAAPEEHQVEAPSYAQALTMVMAEAPRPSALGREGTAPPRSLTAFLPAVEPILHSVPGSALHRLIPLEARLTSLEDDVQLMWNQRAERALRNSVLPGLEEVLMGGREAGVMLPESMTSFRFNAEGLRKANAKERLGTLALFYQEDDSDDGEDA